MKLTNTTLCWSFSTSPWGTYHNSNRGYTSIFIDSSNNVNFAGATINNFYTIKGVLLIISWTLLNTIGIVFAAYFKYLPYWVMVHRLCSGTAALITIIVGLIAVNDRK